MSASVEIEAGQRLAFGENWARFLALIDDDRIQSAARSVTERLGDISGRTFLDVGCGSGLFSLAARNLGARVVSFDFDPKSVACADALRRRYRPDDGEWCIGQGSALDPAYLESLGQFDIVYSWGVLHHTGDMWAALASVGELVSTGGRLFISIYNDQGRASRNWRRVKARYVASGSAEKKVIEMCARAFFAWQRVDLPAMAYRRVKRLPKPDAPTSRARGMDARRDLIDWIGGYPFEVAKPEEVFDFYRQRGFVLESLKTCAGGLGCNEFVFART